MEPNYVVPPGEILREHLEESKRSQVNLARSAGWSTKFVSQLVTGKVSLTVKTAMVLEKETGIRALMWLRLEADYQVGLREGKKR